jgi:hypothetical protein
MRSHVAQPSPAVSWGSPAEGGWATPFFRFFRLWWFWLRPGAASSPPYLRSEDSCETKPIDAGASRALKALQKESYEESPANKRVEKQSQFCRRRAWSGRVKQSQLARESQASALTGPRKPGGDVQPIRCRSGRALQRAAGRRNSEQNMRNKANAHRAPTMAKFRLERGLRENRADNASAKTKPIAKSLPATT